MFNAYSLFYAKMWIAHKEPPVDKCRNYILHQDWYEPLFLARNVALER